MNCVDNLKWFVSCIAVCKKKKAFIFRSERSRTNLPVNFWIPFKLWLMKKVRFAHKAISLSTRYVHHLWRDNRCALLYRIVSGWLTCHPVLVQRRRARRHPFPNIAVNRRFSVPDPRRPSLVQEFVDRSDDVVLGCRVYDEQVRLDLCGGAGQFAEAFGLVERCFRWGEAPYSSLFDKHSFWNWSFHWGQIKI
jgi:hypothetical protein